MMNCELRYVNGHIEVFSPEGGFLFSADSVREAMSELAC